MRYLILSDIHSNLEALTSVLTEASGQYDAVLNCGDMVGYGPDPNEVVDWCREYTPLVVRGNHDVTCATLANLEWFNPVAAKSAEWTHQTLTHENLAWLRGLPQGPLLLDGFEVLHGSPADEDEYLISQTDIALASESLEAPLAFFGHTHVQGCYLVKNGHIKRIGLAAIDLDPDAVYMVNPGSVGQPRDRNPRAAFALFDSERRYVELRRVEYDIAATQQKIVARGLPDMLAGRLEIGR